MNIVIVGGGFCGAIVAKKLEKQKQHNITLIDKKNYFEYSPSLAKILFNPQYHQRLIKPFSRFLPHTKVITDPLLEITPQHVKTKKEQIPFDYLIISTGIDYPIFLENKENVYIIKSGTELLEVHKKISKTKNILIVGGGVIGTELAAEFATKTPQIHITLVHPHKRLLERNTPRVSAYAQRFLETRGVEIIFEEKVINHTKRVFVTDKKRKINADLCFWCAGISCNPWFMKQFPDSIFTPKKALNVNQYLQLEGFSNIFVGGDINSIPEEKTAEHADQQARHIATNIHRHIKNKPLYTYKSLPLPMDICLGDWDGIVVYPPFILPGFIPGIGKKLVEKIGLKRL